MFVLLTIAFLAVSVIVIRYLCRLLRINVKTISLVIAAVLAAAMVALAIYLGTYLDRVQYIRLGVLAIIAALVVTAVNEYLLSREAEKSPRDWPTQVLPWDSLPLADGPDGAKKDAAIDAAATGTAAGASETAAVAPAAAGAEVVAAAGAATEPALGTSADGTAYAAATGAALADETDYTPAYGSHDEASTYGGAPGTDEPAFSGEASFGSADAYERPTYGETDFGEDLADDASSASVRSLEERRGAGAMQSAFSRARESAGERQPRIVLDSPQQGDTAVPTLEGTAPEPDIVPAPAEAIGAAFKTAGEASSEAPTLTLAMDRRREQHFLRPEEPPPELTKPDTGIEAERALPGNDLDSLLDDAYKCRESDIDAAVSAYRKALRLYPDDDYAPFLVIELANLYKDSAQYLAAITLYQHALYSPIIAKDDALTAEFKKSVTYLGVVSNILSKHHAPETPFSEIPEEMMQEIETAYEERMGK